MVGAGRQAFGRDGTQAGKPLKARRYPKTATPFRSIKLCSNRARAWARRPARFCHAPERRLCWATTPVRSPNSSMRRRVEGDQERAKQRDGAGHGVAMEPSVFWTAPVAARSASLPPPSSTIQRHRRRHGRAGRQGRAKDGHCLSAPCLRRPRTAARRREPGRQAWPLWHRHGTAVRRSRRRR